MIPLSPEGQKLENMLSWHHSGFNVYIGDRIYPQDKMSLGNLARYNYSNKFRGMRKKAGTDDAIPAVVPNEISSKESRQNPHISLNWFMTIALKLHPVPESQIPVGDYLS